jgi:hypothetical protein
MESQSPNFVWLSNQDIFLKGMQMKKQILFYAFLFSLLTIIQGTAAKPAFGQPLTKTNGYLGLEWGTSLAQAEKDKGLLPVANVDRITSRAIDYLLMDYHDVDPDDPSRPGAFSVLKAEDDDTSYVFYNGKYCLALTPISEKDELAIRRAVESKYRSLDSKDYRSFLSHDSADDGWDMLRLLYVRYETHGDSRIYFVQAHSYFTDITAPFKREGAFLIYVSDDYFKNGAYAQWQRNKSQKPNIDKEAAEKKSAMDSAKVE